MLYKILNIDDQLFWQVTEQLPPKLRSAIGHRPTSTSTSTRQALVRRQVRETSIWRYYLIGEDDQLFAAIMAPRLVDYLATTSDRLSNDVVSVFDQYRAAAEIAINDYYEVASMKEWPMHEQIEDEYRLELRLLDIAETFSNLITEQTGVAFGDFFNTQRDSCKERYVKELSRHIVEMEQTAKAAGYNLAAARYQLTHV